MLCPFDKLVGMREVKRDYHHLTRQLIQPMNTILSILYECPDCGVRLETSQQVRVTPVKADWKPAVSVTLLLKAEDMVGILPETVGVEVEIKKEDVITNEGEDTSIGGNEHKQDTKPNKPRRKVSRKKSSNPRPR